MTKQEKWTRTWQCMRLVQGHYRRLQEDADRPGLTVEQRRQYAVLKKWMQVMEEVKETLRKRTGKSAARARHDWLVAHTLDLTVFQNIDGERLRTQLTGHRPVTVRYAQDLLDQAALAVQEAAEKKGLLH